jgi:cation diffusion facilitator family transporter
MTSSGETTTTHQPSLTRYAWLSIAAAVSTIGLKAGAYLLTGSVGLLSDAMESLVNLVAAIMALAMLTVAAHPPDEEHAYGHAKAEYFSSGLEGALILLAAASIGYTAIDRLFHPRPIEQLGLGLAASIVASVLNLVVARILLSAGRAYRSITLEADAHHLMTDVWTSAGVVLGIILGAVTTWQPLDSVIALLVAVNIIWSGVQLVRRSALGLLDTALPANERAKISEVLERYQSEGVEFHALRTRQAAARRFMSVHILVPGQWTVQRGHHLLEQVEADIREALTGISVFTHLEPLEDPTSWEDMQLDRVRTASPDGAPRLNGRS